MCKRVRVMDYVFLLRLWHDGRYAYAERCLHQVGSFNLASIVLSAIRWIQIYFGLSSRGHTLKSIGLLRRRCFCYKFTKFVVVSFFWASFSSSSKRKTAYIFPKLKYQAGRNTNINSLYIKYSAGTMTEYICTSISCVQITKISFYVMK